MLKTVSLAELASGQTIELTVGDTLRVVVSFKYVVAEDTVVTLRACPYHYIGAGIDRIGGSCGEANIALERSTTATLKEATVDMPIVPDAEGGLTDGTYGLIAEILGTNVEDHIDDCLIVGGNPAGIWGMMEIILPLIMLGLIAAMIVPMMRKEKKS
jgi:hypothetical protein